ncbi:kelch-like protein 15 isoform X1 [Esox lucius]|uniref:Kelch-like protein 15 n=2 Tax=Esox lucius TaxID=8010 RepID=A0A3P9A188_ESOLU|nr:kelch-like protein 15 isoform X1 [Esox lucius]
MSEGARSAWAKRGCGDSQRRDQGKLKQRKCERPLGVLSAKFETGLKARKRCVMSGGEVEVYLSQVHDGSVSSGFRALYEERLLLDVTLLIEEHHFQAHKALLATQSDYFRVMFTADMRERDQDKIHMKGLTAAGFGHVLRFMYYGSLELSMVTVQEILQAAMYVQLTEAVEFCCSFLLSKICLENCAEVMRLLEDFSVGVEGVQEQLDNFLLENFVPLMSRPDFLSYLSLEKLQVYLDSDALSRFPEIELYESVQAWLRHDRRRWRHTDSVVQSLRFCLMTPANVFEKVKTSEFYRYSRQLRQEVDQALSYFQDVNDQPLVDTRSNRIRSVRPQTAVFRGMIGHSMVNSKILLLHRPKVWWELEGPQVPLRPDCLAIVNNFAFLLGGEELGPDGEFHASSKVYRYDPRQNSWLRMADMSVPRSEFAVGVIGKFIYAVAGRTRDETFYSTERYDITADRWEFVDPYPVNKYGHEGTVLSGKLYITGGITSSSTSKQVCVFDPGRDAGGGVCAAGTAGAGTMDTHRARPARTPLLPGAHPHASCWENKSKMNYARCFHKMISHNGKLYVFGGVCVILRASFESQGCPSTEVYDPETDEWTILASMPIGRSGHGVAVLDRQIMVLGGLCYNGHYSDSILTFDPEDNKWKEDEYPRMPCKLDGLQVCTLHFPEYVLEHVRRCS